MGDDKTTKSPPAPKASFGSRLITGVISLVLVAFLGALLWTTYLNWRKDGRFSFRIFDTAWWRPGVDSAQPAIDGARSAAKSANDALWGDGGLIDSASRWWSIKQKERAQNEAATPAAAAAAPKTEELKRCEKAISDAEIDFQVGLDSYRLANPSVGELDDRRRGHLREARAKFLSVKDLLGRAVPKYESLDGHDAERLADAKALQQYDERLLSSLDRLLEVP
jgi:hypothetical protein